MRGLWLAVPFVVACSVSDKQPVGGDAGVDAPADPGGVPETTITAAPGEFSNSSSVTFRFTSDLEGSTFLCGFDGEKPAACTSPLTRMLGDGGHTFSVRAVSPQGRDDDTPAEHLWTIDTIAPDTMLTQAPPATDNSVMVTFAFGSSEKNVVFDCALDGGGYVACESGAELGPVGDGAHSFAVRARDRAGNVDASPAIHAWSVDTSTPDTQLLSGPSGATASTNASFTFISPDAGGGASFQCAVDGAAFVTCASPFEVNGLGEGPHTFSVRVRDAVGNFDPTPATRVWTVDLTPPNTTIVTGPTGTVAIASASFTFTANEANVSYTCSLDDAPYAACTSPFNAGALAQGAHSFAVRATDLAGHVDASPAVRSWSVDTVAPEVTIIDGPASGSTSGPHVAFGFTVSDGVIECSLDGAAFAPCTSPVSFNARAGSHEFAVRATDAAGNVAMVTRAWSVVCAAPDTVGAAGLLHLDGPEQDQPNAVTGGANATLGSDATVEVGDPAHVAASRFAGGLSFVAAENDHVAWPLALGPMNDFTIELWAAAGAPAGPRDLLLGADGRLALRVTAASPSTVRFSISVVETGPGAQIRTATSAPVAAGEWHHVLASLQQPTLRLWVDGVRTQVGNVDLGSAPMLDALRLGGNATTAYQGQLDEVWLAQTPITTDDAARARFCPP